MKSLNLTLQPHDPRPRLRIAMRKTRTAEIRIFLQEPLSHWKTGPTTPMGKTNVELHKKAYGSHTTAHGEYHQVVIRVISAHPFTALR